MVDKNNKNHTTKATKVVLLDAHAIIHRAYHALPDFATSRGEPTGALYGLTTMILKIVSELRPDYLIACYDLPKPTYRHEVYEGYKAGRQKTDDALSVQLEKSKEICTALNIPIYSKEGFEADDMLGTIVEKLAGPSVQITIASGDMDTLQLVAPGVEVYTLKKGIKDTIIYDEKSVLERFGFEPSLLPDYKGLRGDPSDNIIGIEGIGEKTASDLIKNFGSLENVYKTLEKNPEKLAAAGIRPRIIELLKAGEDEARFSKMLATIRRDAPIDFALPEAKWATGLDLAKAEKLFRDLEFRSLGLRLREVLSENGRNEARVTEPLVEVDEKELKETALALWVVDSNYTNPTLQDVLNFARTESFTEARKTIFTELEKRQSQFVFEEIEKPLLPILAETKRYGVKVDREFLLHLTQEYSKEVAKIEKQIYELAGLEFNIASPKQLGEVLFDTLGLVIKNHKKTGGGAKSTRESELEKLKGEHPVVPLILEYREIKKIISTYLEPIAEALDGEGRLHSTFIQAGAATGRMSSESPNLQNIPIGSDRGRAIRQAFLAPSGSQLVALDYSQIELRIAAFLANDQRLIEIFQSGKDVHTAVAAQVFKVAESEVTKEMRRRAKIINFGILYGMGVTALQANLGTDRQTAQQFLNAYFENFADLAHYLDRVKIEAAQQGYTTTLFGRRRYFEGINSKIPFIKAAAERMAINAPIQGSQADLIKIAMHQIDDFLKNSNLAESAHLIMQIHDELIYEVENKILKEFVSEAKKIMESVLTPAQTLGVPIVVNSVTGANWAEMK